MNLINEMNLTFLSKSMNENFARAAVSAFILLLDPMITELADIKTAVSEAVTNSIIHGYEMSGDLYANYDTWLYCENSADDDVPKSSYKGDYSPSCPWGAEGMNVHDFI